MSAQQGNTVTLLVPGLDASSIPALARAQRDQLSVRGVVPTIEMLAGIEGDFPAAALTAHSLGLPDAGWMRIDPVHLIADHDGLLLVPGSQLSIDADEAATLVAYLSVQAGLDITVADPCHWVMPTTETGATLYPLHDVAGRHIGPWLPEGEPRMRLRRWMNELQMVLHDCPVNRRRVDAGYPAVNSLWPWGVGPLPTEMRWPFSVSHASDPAVAGIALLSGGISHGQVHQFNEIAESAATFVWVGDPSVLEEDWIVPAQAALRSRQISTMRILDGDGADFRLDRWSRWRFWR